MNKILNRLGGLDGLIKYSLQPASITFVSYNYVDIKSDRFGEVPNSPNKQTDDQVYNTIRSQQCFAKGNVYRTEIG